MIGFWLGPARVHPSRLPPSPCRRVERATKIGRTKHFAACLAFASTFWPAVGHAEKTATESQVEKRAATPPKVFTKHIRHSALTAAPRTLEFGLISYGKYAVNERLELSLHPLGFLLWPQLEAKLRWWDTEEFTISTLHAVSYPTWFVNAVAREGTGGLADPTADIPATVQMDLGLLATWRLGPSSWGTLQPFAQGTLGGSLPVLEFPFLYQRLAAANAGWVVGLNAALEGVLEDAVGYEMSATYTHLPLPSVENAFAVEALLEARLLLSKASTLPLGVRFTHARYPYGRRNHWFPYIDYRLEW
jgi:hypothetical protein